MHIKYYKVQFFGNPSFVRSISDLNSRHMKLVDWQRGGGAQIGLSHSREEKKKERGKRKTVRTLADCEWRAAAPGLNPLRLPHARSPRMGEDEDW